MKLTYYTTLILFFVLLTHCSGATVKKEFRFEKSLEITSPVKCTELIDSTPTFCAWAELAENGRYAVSVRAFTATTNPQGEPAEEPLEIFFIVEKSALSPDGSEKIYVEYTRNFSAEWKSVPRVILGEGEKTRNTLLLRTDGSYRIRFSAGDAVISRCVITVESDQEDFTLYESEIPSGSAAERVLP